ALPLLSTAAHAPITTLAITAARGRYIRWSNARSWIGTTLDVGASTTKNHAPAKPSHELRATPHAVAPSRTASASGCGTHSLGVRAIGHIGSRHSPAGKNASRR